MKITQEADYGMRVILYLSKLEYGAKVDAGTMAKHEELPLRFLLKLLRKLIAPGIIKSFRGINGGYSLNKLPEEITLLDVIEAIDGPIYVNRCIADPSFCNAKKGNRCEIHRALSGVQKSIVLQLSNINFSDLKDGNF
ncbi:RrF2 family transcriptional regulator [Clostridium saccharoperbutylacetonicum]|uniref:RrF2 family transcriptional regulator n=1 Tax=Clostridium saccharoperbutylacetonicum TaxID=36745 RepID=UPI0039E8392D